MARMAKINGKNGEEMLAIFAVLAKMARQCLPFCHHGKYGEKLDCENGENQCRKLRIFSPFLHGENLEKDGEWQ